MKTAESFFKQYLKQSNPRLDIWIKFINVFNIKILAEIGVYRGDFAATLLRNSNCIKKYYMIDPWRQLKNWNKPLNKDDEIFNRLYQDTLDQTAFFSSKRVILRGKTTEVIDQIPDGSLDFAYIDGDHTLKGIAIDLIRVYPKIRDGGYIGGDDFCPSIWQHSHQFEPTLIFPFAVYFAEAVSARIYALPALPYDQYLIEKTAKNRYEFIDFTGKYGDISLRKQFLDMF